jgi:hypothetical protein
MQLEKPVPYRDIRYRRIAGLVRGRGNDATP